MSRPSRVSTAPLAITSSGELLVNAHQLAVKDDLAAIVECARKSGHEVFVGLVVPRTFLGRVLHDVDDTLADVVGRLGPELLKRRRRPRQRKRAVQAPPRRRRGLVRHARRRRAPAGGLYVELTYYGATVRYDVTSEDYDLDGPSLGLLRFMAQFGFVNGDDVFDAQAWLDRRCSDGAKFHGWPGGRGVRRVLRVLRNLETAGRMTAPS